MKLKPLLLSLFIFSSLTGCAGNKEPVTMSDFALDTYISVTVYDDANKTAAMESLNLCKNYEGIFSRTDAGSELYKLNSLSAASFGITDFTASVPLRNIIETGIYYGRLTGGAFDITIEPLVSLWNIMGDNPHVPDESDINAAISHINYENVSTEGSSITCLSGTTIDLGAIAKGYIADSMKDFLTSKGISSGIINLGGNILCIGSKPDGSAYKIGIKKPFSESGEIILTLNIKDMSVVSSGIYERYFYENDTLYHHVISPFTGYPADNGITGVTIISEKSVDGDCLSTACLILGLENGIKLINSLENFYAIFITEDNQIYYSNGAEDFVSN